VGQTLQEETHHEGNSIRETRRGRKQLRRNLSKELEQKTKDRIGKGTPRIGKEEIEAELRKSHTSQIKKLQAARKHH